MNCKTVGWVSHKECEGGNFLKGQFFHVSLGGIEAAARRPASEVADSTWFALWLWGAMIGVLWEVF